MENKKLSIIKKHVQKAMQAYLDMKTPAIRDMEKYSNELYEELFEIWGNKEFNISLDIAANDYASENIQHDLSAQYSAFIAGGIFMNQKNENEAYNKGLQDAFDNAKIIELIRLREKLNFYSRLDKKIDSILNEELDIENYSMEVSTILSEIETQLDNLKVEMNISDEKWDEDEK